MANKKNTQTSVVEGSPKEPMCNVGKKDSPDISEITAENELLRSENCELRSMLSDGVSPEYLVVIPYMAAGAQGNEIILAIRGWLKHFRERFRIVVVGDAPEVNFSLPENVTGITHIPHKCQTDNPPMDIVAKLQEVIAEFPEYPGIILTNDDIYPVSSFDITEIRLLKSDGLLTERKSTGGLYAKNRARTLELLQVDGKSTYDYGCHTPVFLETEKLLDLVEKFNLHENACLLTSLYFNYFFPDRIPLKLDLRHDNLKVGVYRQNADLHLLPEICRHKIWVNNSESGWTPEFESIMDKILS